MRHRRRCTLATAGAALAVALLAAGCGGGSPGVASISSSTTVPGSGGTSAPASTPAHALLAAGRCLRLHGIPNMPDPTIATSGPGKGSAILDKRFLVTVPAAVVQRAITACRGALAKAGIGNGPASSSSNDQQRIKDGLAFARCVRRHGISTFPDPNSQGQFPLAGTGINPNDLTAAQLAAATACLSSAHGAISIPPQGNATGASG